MRIEIFCQRCGESLSIDDKGKGTVECPQCFYEVNVPATAADIPRLCTLLEEGPEAAAWALSDLGAVDALPQLLHALQRGFEHGDDNDGMSSALVDLIEGNPESSRQILTGLAQSSDPYMRENANWLLEFCGDNQADADSPTV